jgi:thiol-disulfide isomerase/thioredoxin
MLYRVSPKPISRGALGVIALALGLYVTSTAGFKPTAAQAAEPAPKSAEAKLKRASGGYPTVGFVDAAGKVHHLGEFKGKVVVMNLWATWCAPCKLEMPTLANLQKGFGKLPIAIVPVSIDAKAAVDKAKAFMADNKPLPFFHDADGALSPALKPAIEGYPTSFIYDRKGRLYGVIAGEADWSTPKTRAMLEQLAKSS